MLSGKLNLYTSQIIVDLILSLLNGFKMLDSFHLCIPCKQTHVNSFNYRYLKAGSQNV